MKGFVKKFDKEKGYGFIKCEDGQDVFFHYSALLVEGFKTIEDGAKVEFDVQQSERGLRAANVKKIVE